MKPKTTTITCQDRLNPSPEQEIFFDALMKSYQNLKRILFVSLYGRNRPTNLNKFKKDFCSSHKITSTQYNSLKNECDGIFKSQIELQDFYRKEYEEKVEAASAWIEHKQTVIEKSIRKLNIENIKEKHRARLERKIQLTKFKIHHKKRRLGKLKSKLAHFEKNCALGSEFVPSIVFGTKDLLSKRHRLKANQFENAEQWRKEWEFNRSNTVFFLGDSTEKHRNREFKGITGYQECQSTDLRITIPYSLRELFPGSSFLLRNISLSDRTLNLLRQCLAYNYLRKRKKGDAIDLKEARLPVSYRIKKKSYKKKSGIEVRYYLQTILQIPVVQESHIHRGAIGVDVNADHLAVGIVDRFGNPRRSFSVPFRPYEASTPQNEAALGAMIHDLCDLAEQEGLAIVVEKLKLQFLMAKLKHCHGRRVNRKLSALSYSKIFTMFSSIAARRQIPLISVFAGYSSKLGALNYLNHRKHITSHEAAAFVLARRGMRLKDYLDISHLDGSAPEGQEILSLLQSGPAGPTALRKQKISKKINFKWLKDQYLQFDPDQSRAEELAAMRPHVFTARRLVDSCA